MKKITTQIFTLFFSLLTVVCFGQSPRMTMVEEATQASCGPCASANPALQAMLNANPDKAIFIAYQVWWPGDDAMYEDNTAGVDWRIGDYYPSIGGAPNIVVQGNSSAQSTTYLTQALIDDTYAEMSEFDMNLNAEIVDGLLLITGDITATAEVTGDLRLRLVITEHTINGEDLAFQGTNGETEFHHVFKEFVNGTTGITLEPTWAVGDTYTIDESFDLGTLNVYNYTEIEVVGMIQNDDNKFVHQAAKAEDLAISVNLTNNAAVNSIEGLPSTFCTGEQNANVEFSLQNSGNDELTSATINYNINGGADQTYDWTGSLTTYEKETITLPTIAFEAQAENIVNVTVSNPNGMMDENEADNTTESIAVPLALTGIDIITVEILTDNYADETYWEIRDGNEEVVIWGGNPNVGTENIGLGVFPPPADPAMYENATLYSIEVPIAAADCYTFHITDYYGDGISLSTEPAYWKVLDQNGVELAAGGNESWSEILSNYIGDVTVNIEEVLEVNSVQVFPNPVQSKAAINFDLVANANASIRMTNTIGQDVYVKELGNLSAGSYNESIDMTHLSNGFYLVQIRLNNEVITKKITLSK